MLIWMLQIFYLYIFVNIYKYTLFHVKIVKW